MLTLLQCLARRGGIEVLMIREMCFPYKRLDCIVKNKHTHALFVVKYIRGLRGSASTNKCRHPTPTTFSKKKGCHNNWNIKT